MAQLVNYVVPRHLYRFRSGEFDLIERELAALNHNQIWFSDLFSLNDPMEGYYRPLGAPQDQELFLHRSREMADTKMRVGICCLTDYPTSAPFWGQYAKDASGFCIKYDVVKLL